MRLVDRAWEVAPEIPSFLMRVYITPLTVSAFSNSDCGRPGDVHLAEVTQDEIPRSSLEWNAHPRMIKSL